MARVITEEEYKKIINTMRTGFEDNNKSYKPNNRIATALMLQANLGLRRVDLMSLRLNDIIADGNRYRLNIVEEKTGKKREFTVPADVYSYMMRYCLDNGIKPDAKIFDISVRAIQKHLKAVCEYLKIDGVSTHSFRKFFATNIYINNNYNVVLVQELLQHSDIKTTQRYLKMSRAEVEKAINNHVCII